MFGQQPNKPFGFGSSSFGQNAGFGQPQTSVFGQTSTFGTPATQSGGLFGQSTSTFGTPQQPQQTQSFFGSTQPNTQTSIFGQPQQTQTQTNAFGASAFGSQNRPSFGGFGSTATSTTGTSLFGQQNTSTGGSLFGQPSTSSNVFGQSSFGAAGPSGTPVAFKATTGTDTMIKGGTTQNIQTQHQCITCMKEYENKSFEELRVDDYLANRKFGNQTQTNSFGAVSTSNTGSLFGQTNTNTNTNTAFSFGNSNQPKLFGSGTGFGTTTTQPTSTFGTPAAPNPFGTTTSAANTSVFGQTNTTSSFGGFGNTAAAKPTFGFANNPTPATTTQTATPFGTPKPFGTTTPAFGTSTASPFGATTSQAKPAVSFGTPSFNATSFGNRFGTTTSTFGTPAPTNTFSFGPTTTTQSNIFGTKPTTTNAPFSFSTPSTGTMFNPAPSTGTQPFGSFGSAGMSANTGSFFNSSTTTLGGQSQSSNLQDEIARNRQHIMMISLPLGGDPFFKCEVKKEQLRPTSLAAQKSVLERTVKPNTPPAPKSKVIPVSRSASHASLFAGLEDGDNTALGPSPKTLTIKPKMPECFNSPSIFQAATLRNTSLEAEKLPEPATIVQPAVDEPTSSSPPIHSTPYNPKTRIQSPVRQDMNAIPEEESSLQLAPEKSILRGPEEPSPENENSIGVKCKRHDYYTKPPLKTLKLDRNGDCFVEDFVIGRKDYGSMIVLGKLNVANLDIDGTVIFRRKEITVYPDESKKPPVGQGLNRKAEVTLEAVYPLNRGTRDVMKDPQQLIDSKFREKLESHSAKMGATFVDYDEYTGVWVFRVNHFSRYGLLDDDDDEPSGGDVAMTETRPLQAILPPAAVPILSEKQQRQSMDITQEMSGNYIFSPASIQVCQAMQLDNKMLQGMKASFFMDECDENDYTWTQYHPKAPTFGGFKQHEVEEKKLRMSPPHDRVQTQIALRPKKQLRVALQMTDEFLKKFEKIPMIRPEIDHLEQNRVVNAAAGFQRIIVPAELSVFSKYSKSFPNEMATFNRARLRPCLHHWNLVRPSESVETRSLNITIPGSSKSASSVCFEKIDMLAAENTLKEMMSVQFANSEMRADPNGMPFYSPVRGVELMQNHIKRLEQHDAILEVELSNTLLLCDALWGNEVSDVLDRIETEAARKRALSMWITRVTEDVVSQEVSSSDSSLQRIFSYLSGHQISAACEEAVSQSDYNLATLVAQAAHDQTTKMIVKEMYVEWTQSKKDLHINLERLKLYAVMAGLPEWTLSDGRQVNVCEGLDWLRCFALHLWYICPSNMSIAEVLADYVQATETYATPPEVKHGDRAMSPLHVCFQLMSLYTDRTKNIDKMLCPDTVLGVRSQLEYRHCWLLGQVLQSLQYNVPCMKELHVRMASQLEAQGLWQWAVFALLHIEDPHQRQKYVYDLICRHASATVDLTENESFVQNRLKVPKEILYKAKALRASFEQRRVNQTKLLILADELNEAHEILVNHIAVKAIINEQFDLLQELLHKMSQNFTKIQSWNQKGRVYYNYIQLRSILKDILDTKEDEEAIERILEGKYLEGVLASLSSKLSRLPRDTVEQRLCQIEMAKTTFAAYKNVLTSKSASDPHLKNSAVRAVFQLLRTLPLPEDTVAQEFRRLSDEYPEYLPRD